MLIIWQRLEDIKLNKGNEIENKLIRLEEMKKKGLISEDEYKALRMKALNDF